VIVSGPERLDGWMRRAGQARGTRTIAKLSGPGVFAKLRQRASGETPMKRRR
jgi:hypothetical protein